MRPASPRTPTFRVQRQLNTGTMNKRQRVRTPVRLRCVVLRQFSWCCAALAQRFVCPNCRSTPPSQPFCARALAGVRLYASYPHARLLVWLFVPLLCSTRRCPRCVKCVNQRQPRSPPSTPRKRGQHRSGGPTTARTLFGQGTPASAGRGGATSRDSVGAGAGVPPSPSRPVVPPRGMAGTGPRCTLPSSCHGVGGEGATASVGSRTPNRRPTNSNPFSPFPSPMVSPAAAKVRARLECVRAVRVCTAVSPPWQLAHTRPLTLSVCVLLLLPCCSSSSRLHDGHHRRHLPGRCIVAPRASSCHRRARCYGCTRCRPRSCRPCR